MAKKSKRSLIHFNAGEWSPKVDARVDHQKYPAACRQLQNIIPTPHGAAIRRKGFEFIAETKNGGIANLIEFQVSREVTFCLEFGDQYVRFFRNGVPIYDNPLTGITASGNPVQFFMFGHGLSDGDEVLLSGFTEMTEVNGLRAIVTDSAINTFKLIDMDGESVSGLGWTAETTGGTVTPIYEIASVYLESEVFDLKFAQINNIAFFAHENHEPRVLARSSDNSWTFNAARWDYPALLDENVDPVKELNVSATSGTSKVLKATGHAPFLEAHVGSYWMLGHYNDEEINQSLKSFDAGASSASIFIQGSFTVETTGVWTATQLEIEESSDLAFTSPTVIRTLSGNKDKNYNIQLESLSGGAYYRFTNGSDTATTSNGGGDDRARINPDEAIRQSIVKVTSYATENTVGIDIIRDALSTDKTAIWAEGSWSDVRGHPRAVSFFENRVLYAGSRFQPQTVWGSQTDDYYNFEKGDEDTDSYAFTLASPERNEIIWIGATTRLIIGTTGGEWMASGNDVDTSITPTSIIVRQHSANGVAQVRPLLMEGRLVYMQRGSRKLRGMTYDGVEEKFNGEDLTILSDHLTAGTVVSLAYQAQRDSIVWGVTGYGNLIGMTYELEQGVVGWHRHNTSGAFEAVETIYGTGDDELWVVVKRNINGAPKRFIERMSGYYNPAVDGEPERKIQIAICLDTSGSMSDNFETVIEQMSSLLSDIGARYDDVGFALTVFETDVTILHDFTDAETVIATLETLSSSGSDENGFGSLLASAQGLTWNDNVRDDNIIMIVTDEGNTYGSATQGEVIGSMLSVNARLVYADVDNDNSSDYNNIITSTGGHRILGVSNLANQFLDNVPIYGYSERLVDEFFVDAGVTSTRNPSTAVTGLDHLEGATVQILADGARVPDAVVTGGALTLPFAASVVHVGLPFESILQPMRLDVDSQFGVLQGIEKRIFECVLRLMDTGSVRIKTDESAEWDYVRDANAQLFGETLDIFNGETDGHVLTTGHSTDPTFILSCNEPLPFALVGVILKYTITGD